MYLQSKYNLLFIASGVRKLKTVEGKIGKLANRVTKRWKRVIMKSWGSDDDNSDEESANVNDETTTIRERSYIM